MRFTSWPASMLNLTELVLPSKAESASSNAGSRFRVNKSTMKACCEEAICRLKCYSALQLVDWGESKLDLLMKEQTSMYFGW